MLSERVRRVGTGRSHWWALPINTTHLQGGDDGGDQEGAVMKGAGKKREVLPSMLDKRSSGYSHYDVRI